MTIPTSHATDDHRYVPDWIPETLREHYHPPGPQDHHHWFTTIRVSRQSFNLLGAPTGLPVMVTIYRQSEAWATERVNEDPRWAAYLAHEREPQPAHRDTPAWLLEAPIDAHTLGSIQAVLQEGWERRHRYPHRDRDAYMNAIWDESLLMTEADVRLLWDRAVGIPEARRRKSEAQAQANRDASTARQQAHARVEREAEERLGSLAERLEASAHDRLSDVDNP